MKNFEKYIDMIAKALTTHDCEGIQCDNCEICNLCDRQDEEYTKKWLNEEYKETCPLKHNEYVILKNLSSEWKFIARDRLYDELNIFDCKPRKNEDEWFPIDAYSSFTGFNHLFQFIKWKDEPYEIAKLIEDYEKENLL